LNILLLLAVGLEALMTLPQVAVAVQGDTVHQCKVKVLAAGQVLKQHYY
jgi:hypothetical protein